MLANEQQLAERVARRDRKAFATLYDAYADKIYKYIYFKSGGRADAEDLTAQVFLKAWEAIDRYYWTGSPFSTWLYRIAHNQLVDHYRLHHETSALDPARTPDGESSPLEQAEHALMLTQFRSALKDLTRDQQQVITLHFIEGYSTAEVARLMHKNPEAIRSLKHRALRALQSCLADEARRKPACRVRASTGLAAHSPQAGHIKQAANRSIPSGELHG